MIRNLKRILVALITIQMILSMFTFTTLVQAAGNQSRMLKTLGNKIVLEEDPSVVVRLTGLNIPGAEWTGTPDAERIKRSTTEAMQRWDSNLIRLPVSINGWYGNYDYVHDGGAGYRRYIDEVIQMISEAGKYVVLDLHHYRRFDNQKYLDFWVEAANKYKNNPTVLFGILNEPHGTTWSVWRNGSGTTVKGHQYVVEMIRDLGAKNIIVAGGLDWAYDLRGIVGEASGDPTVYALIDQGSNNDLSKTGNGIMYDTHIYPWKGRTSNWHNAVGTARMLYPILVGENGWDAGTILSISGKVYYPGDDMYHDKWNPELFAWMNDEATYGNLAHYTGWCFHPTSSPRILVDDGKWKDADYSYTPTDYWGVYVKNQLKTDLGQNILLGKAVTGSPSEPSYGPDKAVDNNNGTLWASAEAGDKQVTVDMGEMKVINRWLVRHAGTGSFAATYNTSDFKLQVSNDQSTWMDIDTVVGNTGNITDRFVAPVRARYVRLYITKAAQSGNVVRIYEFSVFGTGTAGITFAQLPTITEAATGSNVFVPVTYKDLPLGTKSFDFRLTYDATKITYQSFIKGGGYSTDPTVNLLSAGSLAVTGSTTAAGVGGDQNVVTLIFSVNQGIPDSTTTLELSNVKYGDSEIADTVISAGLIQNGSIGIITYIDPVEVAKQEAKTELAEAYNQYSQAEYSIENWSIINNAKAVGDATIDVATTVEEVGTAKEYALAAMADVNTILQEALIKIGTGSFTLDDLKDTGASGIIDDNFLSYQLGFQIQKELNDGADLDIVDIDEVIVTVNGITPEMRGDVIYNGTQLGIYANDAAAVKSFLLRQGKPIITLGQVIRADYDKDGIVNVIDIINILIIAAQNNVPD